MNKNSPIGLLDSGVGGLSLVKTIKRLLPSESIVYFGDTCHFPYGEKTSEEIRAYLKKIFETLSFYDCKMIIIACNTAYAASHTQLHRIFGNKIPIINVIDPMIGYIQQNCKDHKIGLIATRRTICSDIYNNKILDPKPSQKICSLATPQLAQIIEKGDLSRGDKMDQLIERYLGNKIFNKIDTLILGCTHYYFIKDKIRKFYKDQIKILDAADMAITKAKSILEKNNLLSDNMDSSDIFICSNRSSNFINIVHSLFGENANIKCF